MHTNVCRILFLKYVTSGNAQSRIKHDVKQKVIKESSEYCVTARLLETK